MTNFGTVLCTNSYIKRISPFFLPCFLFFNKKRFPRMVNNIFFYGYYWYFCYGKLKKSTNVQSKFQRKLKENIQLINSESKSLTFINKTINLQKLWKQNDAKNCWKIKSQPHTKKKTKASETNQVTKKKIVKEKTVANRNLVNGHDECFTSLKDSKPNF